MAEDQPWRRAAGEPAAWFRRFERFCRAGAGRSVAAVYDQEQAEKRRAVSRTPRLPERWQQAAARWEWPARAAAWDGAEARRGQAEEQQARLEARRLRRQVLQVVGRELMAALERLKPEDVTLPDVVPAVRLFEEQMRAEYEGLPEGRGEAGSLRIANSQVVVIMPDNGRGDR